MQYNQISINIHKSTPFVTHYLQFAVAMPSAITIYCQTKESANNAYICILIEKLLFNCEINYDTNIEQNNLTRMSGYDDEKWRLTCLQLRKDPIHY